MAGSLDRAQVSHRKALARAQTASSRVSTHSESSVFTLEEFFILGVLRDREMYGLQIVRSLSAHSDFGIPLGTGVIYPTLKTLVKKGLLCSRQANGSPRVYYALTDTGRERLKAMADRLANLGNTAQLLAAASRSPA